MKHGQLNSSGLTLGDIQEIKASFVDNLKGRFHVRVKYPGNEELEAPESVPALPSGETIPLITSTSVASPVVSSPPQESG